LPQEDERTRNLRNIIITRREKRKAEEKEREDNKKATAEEESKQLKHREEIIRLGYPTWRELEKEKKEKGDWLDGGGAEEEWPMERERRKSFQAQATAKEK